MLRRIRKKSTSEKPKRKLNEKKRLIFNCLWPFRLLIFYKTQDHLLYHPDDNNANSRDFVMDPSAFSLPFQNIFIQSEDGTRINLYFIRHPDPKGLIVPTLVFFHGNAGNMGHRLQNAAGLYTNLQCNVLMVEYRGYGRSQGHPTEKGLYMDARAAMDFLATRPDVNQNKIIVFGRSLGGAVAIDLAARPEYGCRIWCLIVENTFTSIPEIMLSLFKHKWLRFVPLFAYKNKYLSTKKIVNVNIPTLFISGLKDRLVPPKMMTTLFALCPSPNSKLLQITSGRHNDTWTCNDYYRQISEFLQTVHSYKPNPPSSTVINI
ncbi:protein ABHD13 isoform X2 [Cimex lectularius]|uniref:Serine aminopeptidase S33 domain-containing protein n=1 Tax=Cimex lectularius TaxID=79782 RepID=A0A8I6RG47_CIMLE|nr:protein ABHD13 isoform X2 [Cimex lectularius]